jgi:glycosyltransferase involved in cell wall biosynthesis
VSVPLISVVIAAHGNAIQLSSSLESILAQTFTQFECVVVCDGALSASASCDLSRLALLDSRIRVFHQKSSGLTQALILGCSFARGIWISRLDVGDVMYPRRLERQHALLDRYPSCVLATSDVRVCGPCWEYLRTDTQVHSAGLPLLVDTLSPEKGINFDIPHHASVTFRRDAYLMVGGYRREFYFGQDWDLWYRLAAVGSFLHLPEVLTCVRLFSNGLSSRFNHEQKLIAELSLACYVARRRCLSESKLLFKAYSIRPVPSRSLPFETRFKRSDGYYFIAESLRRNGDPRCRRYFLIALSLGFWRPRIWLRSIQCFLG